MHRTPHSFWVLVTVFFFWGFVAASNDILIPVFKSELHLQQWQSQLISFAFYIAYTVGSVLYYVISKAGGRDLLSRLGYKNGIALGLCISALGTLLFIPAANSASFTLMITGLFIVGLGFSLQQTAANPLAITLGHPKKGAQRLSLAGGINNIGTTVGPVLVSIAIFGSVTTTRAVADISNIKTPYLVLGLAFLVVALFIKFSSLPNHREEVTAEDTLDQPANDWSSDEPARTNAFAYPQLTLGMVAIFLYVGVEVSTGGNLGEFLKTEMHLPTGGVAPFVSLFWASLMIGRWTAAAGIFSSDNLTQKILGVVMPYMAFGLFLVINYAVGNEIKSFYPYVGVVVILIAANFLSRGNPARQLLLFSLCGITALCVGMLSKNPMVTAYAFMSVGLFCSTLWPCIFTLAIAGLRKHTNEGSGLLIMMIMGGGFVSLFQGWLAGTSLGIKGSYITGVACFAYLAFYAVKAQQILKKEGIDYDREADSGH